MTDNDFESAVRERITQVVEDAWHTRGTNTNSGRFQLSPSEISAAGITPRRLPDVTERLASVTNQYDAKRAAEEIATVLLADMTDEDAVLRSMLGK